MTVLLVVARERLPWVAVQAPLAAQPLAVLESVVAPASWAARLAVQLDPALRGASPVVPVLRARRGVLLEASAVPARAVPGVSEARHEMA
ncbi:hypothetical protein AQJ46_06280 [Streptomyces canus]|uniref:Uncharacterized protein n=1 Tax=Streptomyces canus TaxID=58343 RepID=A0A101SH88_9ACTN|nr:hypothetical protein AQJ46_06280 [Streptomyces canus]